jgi:hypothetical protein
MKENMYFVDFVILLISDSVSSFCSSAQGNFHQNVLLET